MRGQKDKILRNELKLFFDAATDLSHAARRGDATEVELLLEEIDTMRMHTTQPGLRRRCARLLAEHRSVNVRFG